MFRPNSKLFTECGVPNILNCMRILSCEFSLRFIDSPHARRNVWIAEQIVLSRAQEFVMPP
jgi:hypothetical protein